MVKFQRENVANYQGPGESTVLKGQPDSERGERERDIKGQVQSWSSADDRLSPREQWTGGRGCLIRSGQEMSALAETRITRA